MIRSPLRPSALLCALVLAAAAGCIRTLAPIDDPSGNGNTLYDLDLGLPEQLESVEMKTVPYVSGLRLHLVVEDARQDRVHVGEVQGEPSIPIQGSGMTPAVFVEQVVSKELADSGITFVDGEDASNRILRLRLVRFFTQEHHMYHGEVHAIAEVLDSNKHVIAAITAMGSARQFGLTHSVNNYREVFARATMDMTRNVLDNGQIQAALNVQTDTAAPPAPPHAAEGGAI